jgi:hypothetical protein
LALNSLRCIAPEPRIVCSSPPGLRVGRGVHFDKQIPGLGCADPLEYLQRPPQQDLGLRGMTDRGADRRPCALPHPARRRGPRSPPLLPAHCRRLHVPYRLRCPPAATPPGHPLLHRLERTTPPPGRSPWPRHARPANRTRLAPAHQRNPRRATNRHRKNRTRQDFRTPRANTRERPADYPQPQDIDATVRRGAPRDVSHRPNPETVPLNHLRTRRGGRFLVRRHRMRNGAENLSRDCGTPAP